MYKKGTFVFVNKRKGREIASGVGVIVKSQVLGDDEGREAETQDINVVVRYVDIEGNVATDEFLAREVFGVVVLKQEKPVDKAEKADVVEKQTGIPPAVTKPVK